VAARAARDIYPDMHVTSLVGNVLSQVGLGYFRWADVVVGALDNREARVHVNRCCAQVGRPWIDGGIDVWGGIVRGFAPPGTACYECTMGPADWEQLAQRRSCSLLARRAAESRGTPTTPTTASVIGAMQVQEVVKILHGMEFLAGKGLMFEGLKHNSYPVEYSISSDCPWHEPPVAVETRSDWGPDTALRTIWNWARQRLGGLDAIDFSRELVERIDCTTCGKTWQVLRSIDDVDESLARCTECGKEGVPRFLHSISEDGPLLDLTVDQLGLPAWDVVWLRRDEDVLGVELAAGSPADLIRV
jgi:hypothetical protein